MFYHCAEKGESRRQCAKDQRDRSVAGVKQAEQPPASPKPRFFQYLDSMGREEVV